MKNTILSAVVLCGEGRKDSMGAGFEDMKMVWHGGGWMRVCFIFILQTYIFIDMSHILKREENYVPMLSNNQNVTKN